MERSRGVKVYGISIVIYGIYNLIGLGSYKQFAVMFGQMPAVLIMAVYIFTIMYGVCGIYCGGKILRLEDWARKVMIALTGLSVIIGLALNRTVMISFNEYLLSEQSGIPVDMAGPLYMYTVVIMALITIYELSILYFFTRPSVVRQFES